MHSRTKILAGAFAAVLVLGFSVSAMAGHGLSKRAEVSKGLKKENKRDITKAEKHQLHHDDHEIRKEERDIASHDDGHITKHDEKLLDEQEKDVKRQANQ